MISSYDNGTRRNCKNYITVLSVTASKFLFVLNMKMNRTIFNLQMYTQKYELGTLFRKTHIL